MNLAILGAGAWGTALAINLCARHEVTLWTKFPNHLTELTSLRINQSFLPEFPLPQSLNLTSDLELALDNVDLAIIVVPVAALRETMRRIVATGKPVPVIWGCKGFESKVAKLPHQIVTEEYANIAPYGVLSGPSFAQEVAQGLPTALTLASDDEAFSQAVSTKLHSNLLRIYSSTDVVGVEIGGAVKNVITIAAGISDGMGFGHNARAALITRGLLEMTRLGIKLGGCKETFMGLSGVGDLILTSTGDLSRNRRVGLMLAEGQPIADILEKLGHVAEGVHTAQEVHRLSQTLDIEMPIIQAVCSILNEEISARNAVELLLNREPTSESF